MKKNVDILAAMHLNLEGARIEMEAINRDEAFLGFQETPFPIVQQMFLTKDPYDKLWNTALQFTLKNEEWTNGEFCPTLEQSLVTTIIHGLALWI